MSWWTDTWSAPYNAFTGKQTQAQIDAGVEENVASINAVSENAATYYGQDSDTAQIAAQTAAEQAAQVGTDVSTLQKLAATDPGGCPQGGLNLNGLGMGCISSFTDLLSRLNTLTKYGLVIVALLIVGWIALTFGPTVAAVSRRR